MLTLLIYIIISILLLKIIKSTTEKFQHNGIVKILMVFLLIVIGIFYLKIVNNDLLLMSLLGFSSQMEYMFIIEMYSGIMFFVSAFYIPKWVSK